MSKVKNNIIKSTLILSLYFIVTILFTNINVYAVNRTYTLDTDGIDIDSEYVIAAKKDNGEYRILYHAKGSTLSDVVPADSMNNNKIVPNNIYSKERQSWKITGDSNGYYIESLDDNYYLNIDKETTSKVPVTTTKQLLKIEKNSNGTYNISNKDSSLYLYYKTSDTTQFNIKNESVELYFFKKDKEPKYKLDSNGIDNNSNYVILANLSNKYSKSNRILYSYESDNATTDQVDVDITEDEIKINSSHNRVRQLWQISGNDEDGYTIMSLANNRYLAGDSISSENEWVQTSNTSKKWNIEKNDNGTYYIYFIDKDNKKVYLYHNYDVDSNNKALKFQLSYEPTEISLYKETNEHEITLVETKNGKVSVSKTKDYEGENIKLTINPDEGYELDKILVNGKESTEEFDMLDEDIEISVTFKKKPVEHKITLKETEFGKVTLDKNTALKGELVTVNVTPNDGYELNKILVNGKEIDNNSFEMPDEDVEITVSFNKIEKRETDDTNNSVDSEEVPNTYDGITKYILIFITSLISLIVLVGINIKKQNNN